VGHAVQVQTVRQLTTKKILRVIERSERLLSLVRPLESNTHAGVPQVGRDVHLRYGSGTDARVRHLVPNEFSEFFPNRFRYALCPVSFHGATPSIPKSHPPARPPADSRPHAPPIGA